MRLKFGPLGKAGGKSRLDVAETRAIDAEAAAAQALLSQPVPATPAELHALRRKTRRQLQQTVKAVASFTRRKQEMNAGLDRSIARDIAMMPLPPGRPTGPGTMSACAPSFGRR